MRQLAQRLAIVAVLAVAIGMAHGPVSATDEAPIISVSPPAIGITDSGPAEVTITNDAPYEVTVTALLIDSAGQPVDGSTGLEDAVSMPPGGRRTIDVEITETPTPGAELVLVAVPASPTTNLSDGNVIRVPISADSEAAAKAAVSTWTVWYRHGWPFHDTTGATIELPLDGVCDVSQSAFSATLQGDGEALSIETSCNETKPSVLKLEFPDPPSLGHDYTGTLDLTPDADEGEIEVTVKTTTRLYVPIVLLLVSGGAGVAIEIWRSGRRRNALQKQQASEVAARARNADWAFRQAAIAAELAEPIALATIEKSAAGEASSIQHAIDELPRSASDDELKAIDGRIAGLELALTGWPTTAARLAGRIQCRPLRGGYQVPRIPDVHPGAIRFSQLGRGDRNPEADRRSDHDRKNLEPR